MIRLAALAVFVALTTGCGKRSVGEDCKEATECGDKTSCILYGAREVVDGGPTCDPNKKLCSITCTQDTDCAALGTGHICLKDCFMGSCLKGSR